MCYVFGSAACTTALKAQSTCMLITCIKPKNAENAVKLIEFLASAESQVWYSAVNNEYPVVAGSEISETLQSWGTFKQDNVDLSILGSNNRTAVKMMDRANWK